MLGDAQGLRAILTSVDHLWDLLLFVLGLAFAALGLVNPTTAPLWAGLFVVVLVAAVAHWQRRRLGAKLVNLGVRMGGHDAAVYHVPVLDPSNEPPNSTLSKTTAHARDEQRAAIKAVRDALTEAMTHAENDREHGVQLSRQAAVAAANRAGSIAPEIEGEEGRQLVRTWKAQFDAIQKGWKEGGMAGFYSERQPPGYPEPGWGELRAAADAAHDRLGAVLRHLQGPA